MENWNGVAKPRAPAPAPRPSPQPQPPSKRENDVLQAHHPEKKVMLQEHGIQKKKTMPYEHVIPKRKRCSLSMSCVPCFVWCCLHVA